MFLFGVFLSRKQLVDWTFKNWLLKSKAVLTTPPAQEVLKRELIIAPAVAEETI